MVPQILMKLVIKFWNRKKNDLLNLVKLLQSYMSAKLWGEKGVAKRRRKRDRKLEREKKYKRMIHTKVLRQTRWMVSI